MKGIQWNPRTFLLGDGLEIERNALVLFNVYAVFCGGVKCELDETTRSQLVLPMDEESICVAQSVERCWDMLFREVLDDDDAPRFYIRCMNVKQLKKGVAPRFRKWTDQDEIELDGLGLFRFARHFAK